jgi:colicin import membrane protein
MEEPSMSETTGTSAIEAAANALTDAGGQAPAETGAKQGEPAETGAKQESGDETLGEGGKKALKAEREARTAAEKQAAELKAKLDKIEAANMSDLERAQKEAADAKAEAAKASVDVLRFRVAAQHGISEEDAELFLTGTDAETLTKQATRLKDRTPTTPRPDPSQGAQNAHALNGDALTDALSRAVGANP